MADWASISKIKGNQYGGGSSGAAGFQAWGGGQTGVGGTGKPSATPQDLVAKFDAMDKRQIGPGSVGVQAPTEIAALGATTKIDATGGADKNFFTEGLGTTTPINPSNTLAKGENQDLQKALTQIGSGELTPRVDANKQWWA